MKWEISIALLLRNVPRTVSEDELRKCIYEKCGVKVRTFFINNDQYRLSLVGLASAADASTLISAVSGKYIFKDCDRPLQACHFSHVAEAFVDDNTANAINSNKAQPAVNASEITRCFSDGDTATSKMPNSPKDNNSSNLTNLYTSNDQISNTSSHTMGTTQSDVQRSSQFPPPSPTPSECHSVSREQTGEFVNERIPVRPNIHDTGLMSDNPLSFARDLNLSGLLKEAAALRSLRGGNTTNTSPSTSSSSNVPGLAATLNTIIANAAGVPGYESAWQWRAYTTPGDQTYYYNEVTKMSQWHCPPELDRLLLDIWKLRNANPFAELNANTRPNNIAAQFSPTTASSAPNAFSPTAQSPTTPNRQVAEKNTVYGPPGSNLFIFHIPAEWEDSDLIRCFEGYGQILSARIRRDNTGRNVGYGFVSFTNQASAKHAIAGMNGYFVNGKWLKVSLKKGEQDYSSDNNANNPNAAVSAAVSTNNNNKQTNHTRVPNEQDFLQKLEAVEGASAPESSNCSTNTTNFSNPATPISGSLVPTPMTTHFETLHPNWPNETNLSKVQATKDRSFSAKRFPTSSWSESAGTPETIDIDSFKIGGCRKDETTSNYFNDCVYNRNSLDQQTLAASVSPTKNFLGASSKPYSPAPTSDLWNLLRNNTEGISNTADISSDSLTGCDDFDSIMPATILNLINENVLL